MSTFIQDEHEAVTPESAAAEIANKESANARSAATELFRVGGPRSQRVILVDSEDIPRLSQYTWLRDQSKPTQTIYRATKGRPRRQNLAPFLIGPRPSKYHTLYFRDRNILNYSKSNLSWRNDCYECGKTLEQKSIGYCTQCFIDSKISHSCGVRWHRFNF